MAIDQTIEFQAILDILACFEVTHQTQQLIIDAISSNIETWEQLHLQQRSRLLQSTLLFLKESPERCSQTLIRSYFESHLVTIS